MCGWLAPSFIGHYVARLMPIFWGSALRSLASASASSSVSAAPWKIGGNSCHERKRS